MESAIGVFDSRDRADEAVKELKHHVPEDSIIFLTRSDSEAKAMDTVLDIESDEAGAIRSLNGEAASRAMA